ncbi:PadR family transcriptional regulator [Halobaculum sp. CBA1158]|uniref:PadR family transcriptional regulator n=1 Tax=Halobaculum sp. CBA1158 TaxID=2904243 RepID=UPI001F2908AA|nr:PadR family transcriptional regulator [Halobaculum sp. CBA1158]UIP01213.1 PadR family transcriptional regulator [Halobaculum sp. CBA1158]
MGEADSTATASTPGERVGPLDLTAFQTNILAILSEEALYGLAIKRALEDYYDTEVNHGRLYPNLDTLVDEGLVAKSELDKRTNEYALTDAGEAVVRDRLGWVLSHYVTEPERVDDVYDLLDVALGGEA